MGSCLAPVLANIILTEFEKLIVGDLVNSGILKFYRRYVDDTLVLMKVSDIPFVLNKFNSFDKNLNFTVNTFDSGKVHFLDLEISQSGINIYRKNIHLNRFTHISQLRTPGITHARRSSKQPEHERSAYYYPINQSECCAYFTSRENSDPPF